MSEAPVELEFKLSAAVAELTVISRQFARMQRQEAHRDAEAMYQRRRAEHLLEVKREMHRVLDALYRKTKAERDAALAELAALKEGR